MSSLVNKLEEMEIEEEDSTKRIKDLLEEQYYLDEPLLNDGLTYREYFTNKYLTDVEKFNQAVYLKTYGNYPKKCEELKNNELFFEVLLVLQKQEEKINELEKKLESLRK